MNPDRKTNDTIAHNPREFEIPAILLLAVVPTSKLSFTETSTFLTFIFNTLGCSIVRSISFTHIRIFKSIGENTDNQQLRLCPRLRRYHILVENTPLVVHAPAGDLKFDKVSLKTRLNVVFLVCLCRFGILFDCLLINVE